VVAQHSSGRLFAFNYAKVCAVGGSRSRCPGRSQETCSAVIVGFDSAKIDEYVVDSNILGV